MDFPRLVYTSPWPCECAGGSYGFEKVLDEEELEAALEAGFYATLPEALNGDKGSPDEKVESVESKEVVDEKPAEKKRGRPAKN